ncbi:MAG TPA: thrombospondin type 3 repeat-containing protein, partial [Methylomirabilota bacterium]|nr:thrombospondin type 3 repeat-containing protein [Methylomirabilota bacterium]
GAPFEDSDVTGVNGDQANNNAINAGAAYIFVRNGTNWTQQAYLKASNAGEGSLFGLSVTISGDTVVVGATGESSNAMGVNGDPGTNDVQNAGAVYIFVRTGTNWSQQAYLKASNTGPTDNFGSAVAISENTLVVGARNEDSNATGANGNQNDDSTSDSGAAYIFVRTGTNWSQQAYLKASNSGPYDSFGFSAAVDGETVVVGAYGEASNATGVNGNQTDNSAYDSGAAYVFVRNGTNWTQQAYLKASNSGVEDNFGFAVALSAGTLVVGAWGEDSNATAVNGNQNNNSAFTSGAAYVFVRSGTNWTQQAYLKTSNAQADDFFAVSVAISGDTIVAGAPLEASNGTGPSDNSAPASGAAYVFVRTGTNWTQQSYLKASNPGGEIPPFEAGDGFGRSVAVSGGTILVGAQGEDSNATGVNGNQNDNSVSDSGASYVFTVSASVPAAPFVTGDRAGLNGTTHAMAFDGSLTTFFHSSYNEWQYLQVDFGAPGRFSGLRRYMTSNGTNTVGRRTTQGEGAQYSMDGVNWIELTAANALGWEGYINYGARLHAWRDVPYGWSTSLIPTNPVSARYVRFNWDGDNDALNELEIAFTSPAAIATDVFTAIADAQTVAGQPGVNYGSQTAFSVAASSGSESIRSYLRFDLSGIPPGALIHSAQLEAFVQDVSGAGTRKAQVFAVNAPWVEDSIRESNQPPVSAPGATRTLTINESNTWDVTALVNSWVSGTAANNGMALLPVLVPGESFSTVFRSREAPTNHPRLIVSYGAPPHPQNTAYLRLRQESVTPPVGYFNGGLPTTLQVQWPIPTNAPADPLLRALDFLDRFRGVYRLTDPRGQLVPSRRTTSATGRHVIFEQIHEGLPVVGSQLAVHLTKTHVIGTGGRWLAELPLLPPATLTAAQAETVAKAWCEEQGAISPNIVGRSRLVWFNPSLFGYGTNRTWLVWRVSVSGLPEGKGASWSTLIDAHTGERRRLLGRLQTTELPNKNFTVHTSNGNTNFDCSVTAGSTAWFDTAGPTGYPGFASDALLDGTNAWRFLHQTYDYFYNTFGRRSWNNADMPVAVYTHAGFDNAFYEPNCNILAFGDGNVTDDIFAHEFTHGVTRFTANLEYETQSGALNESFSDVFAMMVDTDDWLLGEDQPGGISRSLADPTLRGQPDHMNNFAALPPNTAPADNNDWGRVHRNSGIPNKVAFLLGNGGSHRGFAVRQVGRPKVQRLWYDVLTTRLGNASQFIDLRNEVVNLAREYRRQNLFGFTTTDICDVLNAFASVGLGAGDLDCDGVDNLEDPDSDGDGIPDSVDNCTTFMNWGQFDHDGDGIGDECDYDDDNDGVPDFRDNAPYTYNPTQDDHDFDGIGDVIDDSDGDGILDIDDNCPCIANRDQLNTDGSTVSFDTLCIGIGDACDSDDDDDGVPDGMDNAPKVPNPDQLDTDGDGFGDVIDKCPTTFTPPFQNLDRDGDGLGDVCDTDIDGDGIPNALDNCPTVPNPDQLDLNGNGIGYACDPNEQIAYPRFDARRFEAEFRFINDARVLQLPLDFCVTPPCGEPLTEDFLAEMRLSLPAGIRVRIVDDQGFVVARGQGSDLVLRFPPRSDWAYELPLEELGGAFAVRLKAGQPETYRGTSYTLELERDATVPSNVPLPVIIEVGTVVSSTARLEIRYEESRPVVTIIGSPFREYRLESSTDLLTWLPVITASTADGKIVYTGEPAGSGHRFYRAELLP